MSIGYLNLKFITQIEFCAFRNMNTTNKKNFRLEISVWIGYALDRDVQGKHFLYPNPTLRRFLPP